MCEQREKLLSYVYDEGDAAERAEVQKHLDQCHECRAEIAGLRSVRNDLLAWEVPAHQPVWRPFVTAPPVPWWRQVPSWAMAAAAGVMILLGATGSVIAQKMAGSAAQNQIASAPAPVVTPQEMSASEKRLMAQIEQQIGQVGERVDRVSNRAIALRTVEGDHDAMAEWLKLMSEDYRTQLKILTSLSKDLVEFKQKTDQNVQSLEQKIANLTQLVNSQISAK